MGTKLGNFFRKVRDIGHDIGGTVLKPALSLVGLENDKFTPRTGYGKVMDKITDFTKPISQAAASALSGGVTNSLSGIGSGIKSGNLGSSAGSLADFLSGSGGVPKVLTTGLDKGKGDFMSKITAAFGAINGLADITLPSKVQEQITNNVQYQPLTGLPPVGVSEVNSVGKTSWLKGLYEEHLKPASEAGKDAVVGSVTDTFLKTEEGKEIKKTAIKSQLLKYIWVPFLLLGGVVAYLLFKRK